jgi:adenylate cyclase
MRAPDAWFYDLRTALFGPRVDAPRRDIAVVIIDDDSLSDGYASRSPVDRGLQATLVRALAGAGAKAIGLDFIYDRATPADVALLKALNETRAVPVVLGALDARTVMGSAKPIEQQERFIAASGRPSAHLYFARQGAKFTIGDQIVRYWLGPSPFPPYRKGLDQTLAEAVGKPVPAVDQPQLIAWQRPPDLGGFTAPVRVLKVRPHAPGAGVADLFYPGWEDLVRGRIVLVGGGFDDIDRHYTPLSALDHDTVPGVLVHAQILAQLLDGRTVPHTLPAVDFAMAALAALAGFVAGSRWRLRSGDFGTWLLGGLAILLVGIAAYAGLGIIIPSASLYVAWVAGVWVHWPPPLLRRLMQFARRRLGFEQGGLA